jgi:hypothetical protein
MGRKERKRELAKNFCQQKREEASSSPPPSRLRPRPLGDSHHVLLQAKHKLMTPSMMAVHVTNLTPRSANPTQTQSM